MADDTIRTTKAAIYSTLERCCGVVTDEAWNEHIEPLLDALIAAVRAEHTETVIAVEGPGVAADTVVDGYSYSADVVRQKIAAVRAENAAEMKAAFDAGWHDGVNAVDKFGEQISTVEEDWSDYAALIRS